ncbi:Uncharacterised protein [Raoultella planticola]|nr:Uncharacterised protein [Raoultella planticola]
MTRFARPAGSLFATLSVCPTGCRQLSTPGRGFSSPRRRATCKKKPAFSCELFFKDGGEGGIDSLCSPCGQPVRYALSLSSWLRQLSTPGRGFSSPLVGQYAKKKPVLAYELFLKYGGEGGIDSLCSPCGQPVRYALSLSNWLSPVVDPRSGILIPPQACNMQKKSPHFHANSSLNMAVRGGLTRFARPAGSLFATLSVCPTGCRQLSTPGRGFSSPRRHATCKKKARIFMRTLL